MGQTATQATPEIAAPPARRVRMRRAVLAMLGTTAATVLGVLLGTASPASAADVTLDLYAVKGTTTLPNGVSVPVLGYNDTNALVTRPGGPVLVVNEGDVVHVALHNRLGTGVSTSLLLGGQPLQPDTTGIGNGGDKTYSFTAEEPGTFLYGAGMVANTQYQTAMGLYGALVVLPTDGGGAVIPGQAYGDASTAYDSASVLVLSEIDPVLNNTANPATFDMRNYKPRYFLVDGHAHPAIDAITAAADSDVLLRYANAGITNHSMGVLGATDQTVIALDGHPLRDARHYVADTIGPGQTLDSLVHTPASASTVQRLSVYDANLTLRNANSAGFGGMLATVEVDAVAPGSDTLGPVTTGAGYAVVDADTVTATVDDSDRGGTAIAEARAFVDDLSSTPIALSAADGAFDSATEDVTGVVTLGTGDHVVYVQGYDGTTWGPVTSVLVGGADSSGPTVVQPVLTPKVVRQPAAGAVAITATGDDSSAGNSNVVAAEYSLGAAPADPGTGTAMTVTSPAPVAALTGSIGTGVLNGLAEGNHNVWVRAQDAGGHWGEAVVVNLAKDTTAPEIQGGNPVTVTKTPNNGLIPLTPSQQFVRVSVTDIVDPSSSAVFGNVDKVEMFLDTQGTTGSGIPLTASDGLFNDQHEGAYGDIPLTTVRQMTDGSHTIWVHARDNAGNWSSFSSGTLVVDKTGPTLTGLTITPNPATGVTTLTVSGTANDALTGVAAAEWFVGSAPVGTGTPLTVSGSGPYSVGGTINVADLGEGVQTIKVRVKDGTGNWSAVSSVNVTVTPAIYYSTFGTSNPPGVAGTADDADIYYWNGANHSRSIDVSVAYSWPTGANVDGFDRVSATEFYVSFDGNVTLGGTTYGDEDVLHYVGATRSLFFDGSARGLPAAQDLDAISVVGGTLYFSTATTATPPGAGGAGDDADVYRWNGNSTYTRVWDASTNGLAAGANVDGLVWVNANQLYVSFEANTTAVPGLGNVPDENVVFLRSGAWKTYFNGNGHGLTSGNLDIDAFDLP